ncbi:hypothetical protein [Acinetobacter sp. ANC 4178]|uniref:hypothetical protein n=1 Tax=Acinetobacter sp. ANC 4178 TaxID=2529839 RepID=UPI00103B6D4D|nr:hypothetical protein [Acinetobacter sp. ANC 4178]TCB68682.1 hypothetical protein E0H87_01710 [Acinetobacter sp. ANC 4178]
MIYALVFVLGVVVMIPVLVIWYLIKPNSYFLTFNGEIPSRISIFTHHFLAFLLLFMIVGLGVELELTEGSNAHLMFYLGILLTNVFCIYFARHKINLGDMKRVSSH